MEITATITAVGKDAISTKDNMVILFGDQATNALRDVSVIQEFASPKEEQKLTMARGDLLFIDDIKYRVTGIGSLTNPNLQQIGHATLVFKPVPTEDALANALYLSPTAMPTITVGTKLRYVTSD